MDFTRILRSPHGRTLVVGNGTILMGILNVTPDSFFDGGRYTDIDSALRRAVQIVEEGGRIIDIGAESTRPGAEPVSLQEEMDRLLPVVEKVRKEVDCFISVDTYKSPMAREAVKLGADMVNDISGLRFDPEMARFVGENRIPVVIMHIKGTPRDMQKNPQYEDVVGEVKKYLLEGIKLARKHGLPEDQIVIDPGIGFGKRHEHNLRLITRIEELKALGFPVLVGISRKSTIGHILGGVDTFERLEGTLAFTAYLAYKGVDIVRVHDVKENYRVIRVIEEIRRWEGHS